MPLTLRAQLGPITKQYVSTRGNSTVINPIIRQIQALYWQIVDTRVCLCVSFPLAAIVPASMGVNESWMGFF